MLKYFSAVSLAIALSLSLPSLAFAHVVVTPDSVETGAWQTFSISVPNEKDIPTTRLVLKIPAQISHVSPTVQPGFSIKIEKGSDDIVKSITWSGNIPAGQRAEFTFSAQAPAEVTKLNWKADQYYADGSIAKWEQTPTADSANPYSVTSVVDDTNQATVGPSRSSGLAIYLSVAALALSIGGLFIGRLKR